MRVIIKIKSNVPKEGFKGLITNNFKNDWVSPDNEVVLVDGLISRVYPNYRDSLSKMTNYVFIHKNLENCNMLISIQSDDIEIRIFYDHIATLRELSGSFLKLFKLYIIKPHNYLFEHTNNVIISEAHNNNVLDEGKIALNFKDYVIKTFNERKSESIIFLLTAVLTFCTLFYMIYNFNSPVHNSLFYELSSKSIAPFFTTTILTGLNLLIFFWRLKSNTNIIWGHKYDY